MTEKSHLQSYQEAEAWLLSMTDYERMLGAGNVSYNTRTFDLDNFRASLTRLGDPHLQYAVIHVAGTKGKGSACAFLESALRQCGFRAGLYTSPHLFRFTERIRVDGVEISDAEFCRYLDRMGAHIVRPDPSDAEHPAGFRTVFEILTAAAFQYFADQRVDIAIIETGLGGRLDSTNMFDKPGAGPLIDVITAIGLDHTAILGNTLEAIATEKAGIIRPHATAVVAPQRTPEIQRVVEAVLENRCRDIGASDPIKTSASCKFTRIEQDENCYNFQLAMPGSIPEKPMKICPSLRGAHQAANVCTVLTALAALDGAIEKFAMREKPSGGEWPAISWDAVKTGLQNTRWPGRFQLFPNDDVPVVIDGAHCAISATALAQECRHKFGDRPAVIVTGFLRDKAGGDLLGAMFRELSIASAIAVVPPTPRAVTADHITEELTRFLDAESVTVAEDIAQGIREAIAAAQKSGGYVVVFGSLYLVGPAIRAMERP